MADECDLDTVTILFDACNEVFEGEPAGDVMYVLAMLVAKGIREHGAAKLQFDYLWDEFKTSVELEMKNQA